LLTSLQQHLVKTGVRLLKHSQSYGLRLAERTTEPATVRSHTAANHYDAATRGVEVEGDHPRRENLSCVATGEGEVLQELGGMGADLGTGGGLWRPPEVVPIENSFSARR
jgi:hypothetical protein